MPAPGHPAGTEHPRAQPQRMPGTVGMRLAPRGDHGFAQDDEPAEPLQRPAQMDFLAGKVALVEPADAFERGALNEEETPRGPVDSPHKNYDDRDRSLRPAR